MNEKRCAIALKYTQHASTAKKKQKNKPMEKEE